MPPMITKEEARLCASVVTEVACAQGIVRDRQLKCGGGKASIEACATWRSFWKPPSCLPNPAAIPVKHQNNHIIPLSDSSAPIRDVHGSLRWLKAMTSS